MYFCISTKKCKNTQYIVLQSLYIYINIYILLIQINKIILANTILKQF